MVGCRTLSVAVPTCDDCRTIKSKYKSLTGKGLKSKVKSKDGVEEKVVPVPEQYAGRTRARSVQCSRAWKTGASRSV